MSDAPEPAGTDRWETPTGLAENAAVVAKALGLAATVLVVPALAVGSAAGMAFLVLAILAGAAVADVPTALGWLLLGLAIAGLGTAAAFLLRARATFLAGRDREALAAELVGLVDLSEITTATLADLAELTSRGAGIRAVSRARALWRILRRLDVGEHTSRFDRAKWFVPPEVGTTWLLAQIVTWSGAVAWLLVPAAVALRAVGTI
ncbi:hypothetical protein [Pseudactinotalea suaedae]|uniref:hypothetical protein n=1 Tax=Pseudactinotalea suaedae TaxID=1524924 RepID=UPI0012E10DE7|nr:hypothetical protein [Pseudactinotalea suaedae]